VGIAGLIGCLAGAVLHLSFNFLTTAFRIDSVAEAKARERGRSAAQHRAQRQRKRALESPDLPSTPTLVKKEHASRRQRGLLSQTIIEEEDSDF
jgi:hypothetical protein